MENPGLYGSVTLHVQDGDLPTGPELLLGYRGFAKHVSRAPFPRVQHVTEDKVPKLPDVIRETSLQFGKVKAHQSLGISNGTLGEKGAKIEIILSRLAGHLTGVLSPLYSLVPYTSQDEVLLGSSPDSLYCMSLANILIHKHRDIDKTATCLITIIPTFPSTPMCLHMRNQQVAEKTGSGQGEWEAAQMFKLYSIYVQKGRQSHSISPPP